MTGLLLISPWLIGLVLFKLIPILASLGLSFTDFYMLTPEETRFIGLENYFRIFTDEGAGYTLFATIGFAIFTIPFQLAAALTLAMLLNSARLRSKRMLRTLFFLPSIIPSVAIVLMWFGFMSPTSGWLNRLILQPLGLAGYDNLYQEGVTNLLVGINSLWSIGPSMLIILGALQSLPKEIEEAARVDGAGPFRRFFSVTLPLISPVIFFSLVISLIAIFGGVILLDRGNFFSNFNIGGSSFTPYDAYISYMMFTQKELGYASSLAWLFFTLVMVVIMVLFSTSKRWVFYPDREA